MLTSLELIRELVGSADMRPDNERTGLSLNRIRNLELPDNLVAVIREYPHGITFDNDVRFKPDTKSGWEDEDGSLDVVHFYGVAPGALDIMDVNDPESGVMPAEIVAFGESSGGNRLCVLRGRQEIVFWDHESRYDENSISLIARDFDDFVKRLYVSAKTIEAEVTVVRAELPFLEEWRSKIDD